MAFGETFIYYHGKSVGFGEDVEAVLTRPSLAHSDRGEWGFSFVLGVTW